MATTIFRIALLTSAASLVLLSGAASGVGAKPGKPQETGIPNPRGVYSGCYQGSTGHSAWFPEGRAAEPGNSG